MEDKDVKDLNDVRAPYVYRAFPRHVHKFAGLYEDGGVKPNAHKEVADEVELEQALAAGWSLVPQLEAGAAAPAGDAAVDAPKAPKSKK